MCQIGVTEFHCHPSDKFKILMNIVLHRNRSRSEAYDKRLRRNASSKSELLDKICSHNVAD